MKIQLLREKIIENYTGVHIYIVWWFNRDIILKYGINEIISNKDILETYDIDSNTDIDLVGDISSEEFQEIFWWNIWNKNWTVFTKIDNIDIEYTPLKNIDLLSTELDINVNNKTESQIIAYKDSISRDFTLNSIYLDIYSNMFIDPLNWIKDIENLTLEINNENVFDNDNIRVFRALRFKIKYWLEFSEKTKRKLKQFKWLNNNYNVAVSENIYKELKKVLDIRYWHSDYLQNIDIFKTINDFIYDIFEYWNIYFNLDAYDDLLEVSEKIDNNIGLDNISYRKALNVFDIIIWYNIDEFYLNSLFYHNKYIFLTNNLRIIWKDIDVWLFISKIDKLGIKDKILDDNDLINLIKINELAWINNDEILYISLQIYLLLTLNKYSVNDKYTMGILNENLIKISELKYVNYSDIKQFIDYELLKNTENNKKNTYLINLAKC